MGIFGKTDEFVPNPKQVRFLASSSDVLLYGGGAGSGKSLCALIWLLGFNNGTNGLARYQIPTYNGLIFRKNRKDLSDLIKKSKTIYNKIDPGAKFNNSDNYWTFSSGATIYFSYFERFEQCESQIQGQEYQSIVAEEVGQHETDDIFLYCLSRLRDSSGLKPYMRATANPGRYPWLREFFKIGDEGYSTKFTKEFILADGSVTVKRIEYIQALLSDNPHIDKSYEASLMMLGIEERNALLGGRWDAYNVVEGQIFEHELKSMYSTNRIKPIQYDINVPVHTVWDLGINDYCVILFLQYVGNEIRVIDMLKGNNKSIKDFWIPEIERLALDMGYKYESHNLPHDSSQRDKWSGISIFDDVNAKLGKCNKLPRPSTKLEAIQQTRNIFEQIFINKSKCDDLYTDLTNYKREYNTTTNMWSNLPVHNAASHSADALQYISYIPKKPTVKFKAYNPYA